MLLDISKTKAIKLKAIIDQTKTEQVSGGEYKLVAIGAGKVNGENVALVPIAIDKSEKNILFRAESLPYNTASCFTGVIDSDAGDGENVTFLNVTGVSGSLYDCVLNERWAVVSNNNWSVGTNLDKQLAVQSSASYWVVCFVGDGVAVLKNNASGGGGGGGTAESITFFNNVTVTESSTEIIFTFQTETKSVLVP